MGHYFIDFYDLLNIKKTATESQIESAYREKILLYHPNKNPHNPNAAVTYRQLSEAVRTLKNPITRLIYDNKLKLQKEELLREKLRRKKIRQEWFRQHKLREQRFGEELRRLERLQTEQLLQEQAELLVLKKFLRDSNIIVTDHTVRLINEELLELNQQAKLRFEIMRENWEIEQLRRKQSRKNQLKTLLKAFKLICICGILIFVFYKFTEIKKVVNASIQNLKPYVFTTFNFLYQQLMSVQNYFFNLYNSSYQQPLTAKHQSFSSAQPPADNQPSAHFIYQQLISVHNYFFKSHNPVVNQHRSLNDVKVQTNFIYQQLTSLQYYFNNICNFIYQQPMTVEHDSFNAPQPPTDNQPSGNFLYQQLISVQNYFFNSYNSLYQKTKPVVNQHRSFNDADVKLTTNFLYQQLTSLQHYFNNIYNFLYQQIIFVRDYILNTLNLSYQQPMPVEQHSVNDAQSRTDYPQVMSVQDYFFKSWSFLYQGLALILSCLFNIGDILCQILGPVFTFIKLVILLAILIELLFLLVILLSTVYNL
ncbi:uncharacterized protein LOC123290445 [Chrysoperla carnea]|uniref:uncharacterized protein LOC123290445 n=1 Tax=Chrysoperla carnea TaxID=189513 RepID=UPI001D075E92|nr:uncharacterized protein LOC123290445 [Chrysoperla carnea]